MLHLAAEKQIEPLARESARLLRVEAHGPQKCVLRFDRGALEISVSGHGLEIGVTPHALLPDLDVEVLDEEEPWWTVIGAPLAGAWSSIDTEGRRVKLELQLRRDDQNPKRIALEPREGSLDVRAL
jgi:hypothetical protein